MFYSPSFRWFCRSIFPYKTYSGILKWLTLSLFAYVGTIFVVQINWAEVIRGTFIPTISLNGEYLAALIAVLGTTISPYLLFWQSGEEVEQTKSEPNEKPLKKAPQQAPEQLQRIKIDTYIGMAFSNLIAYFIILTAAQRFMHMERRISTVRRRQLRRSDRLRDLLQRCFSAWE